MTLLLTLTLTVMGRRATPLTMKDFPVTFTLTLMRGHATHLMVKDFAETFPPRNSRPRDYFLSWYWCCYYSPR
jgi:hypothetical protein